MAINVLRHLFLLALALSLCSARSIPGEYDDEFSMSQAGPEFESEPNSDRWNQYSFSSWDQVPEDQQSAVFASVNQTEPESVFAINDAPPEDEEEEEVEEVYFDTSDADTIYRAPDDDGWGLSAADVMSDPNTMLETLAQDLGGCGTGNPIDDCWRCDPNWRSHRKALASCVTGFGRNAKGGRAGRFYTVTNSSDDTAHPTPGTLRYGVTRTAPLWIIFQKDMTIALAGELWVNSFKTIDGRGAEVHIVGAQITIQNASHVIVHGIHVHDIEVTGPTPVRVNETETGVVIRVQSDGDAIHALNAQNVWVDHCYFSKAIDGLVDFSRGSTGITVSNNVFEYHNKVMLFGSSPEWTADRGMRATVAYNRFGRGLKQRLPRCRFGAFHIVNNYYSNGWDIYAIGGSEDPTILSQGNVFQPRKKKEVTKHIDDGGPLLGGWKNWNWASSGDVFLGGAYFTGSGLDALKVNAYAKAYSTSPRPAKLVPAMTKDAGPLFFKK